MFEDELTALPLPLSECYPYAAWVGAYAREARPQWWAQFGHAQPQQAAFALAQAANFAFLAFCERSHERELVEEVTRYFETAPQAQRQEFINTCLWYAPRD